MAISWRTELEIGVPEIDEQHKHLVESFNVFLRACRDGQGSSELLKLMEFLDEYVVKHFREEETLQRKLAYPDHDSHRLQHLGFPHYLPQIFPLPPTPNPYEFSAMPSSSSFPCLF